MTKKEIVRQIAERAKPKLTQLQTKEIVQWTFDMIIDALVSNGRIELRKFGVFEVKQRKPRKARNPRTGDRVDVAAKFVVTFQPGMDMEERVRKFAKLPPPRKMPAKPAAPPPAPKKQPVAEKPAKPKVAKPAPVEKPPVAPAPVIEMPPVEERPDAAAEELMHNLPTVAAATPVHADNPPVDAPATT